MTSVDLIDKSIRNIKHVESLEVILYTLRTRKHSMPSPPTGTKIVLALTCTHNNAIKYINNTKNFRERQIPVLSY